MIENPNAARNRKRALNRGISVSPEDMDLLEKHSWCIDGNGYAIANVNGKKESLHRIVHSRMTGRPLGGYVRKDHVRHIEPNKLDCRRENIHVETGNTRNNVEVNRNTRSDNTSGISGVTWNKQRGKWQAHLAYLRKHIYLGRFDDLNVAAKVAEACIELRSTAIASEMIPLDAMKQLLMEKAKSLGGNIRSN